MRKTVAIAGGTFFGLLTLLAIDRLVGAAPPQRVATTGRFPNVELRTHDGRAVRFYDDLIKGKTVAINFMYVACTSF